METNTQNTNQNNPTPTASLPPGGPSKLEGLGLKVFLPLLVIAGLIFAGLVYWGNKKNPSATTDINLQKNTAKSIKWKAVESGKMPDLLPADIILEKDAQVLQKYNGEDQSANMRYSSLKYVSENSPQKNFTLFRKYFYENHWAFQINAQVLSDTGIYKFTVIKNADVADLLLDLDSNNQSVVDITVSRYLKATPLNKK